VKKESRKMAGILFVVLPSVAFGGVSLLTLLINPGLGYMENPLRQNLWRAGHAHAGVFLLLSLVVLRYVDEAELSEGLKRFVRTAVPLAAILLPVAFFLSVLSPKAQEPNGLIYLAYAGAVVVMAGLMILGIGLLKKKSGPDA
jgi:drug/metabolite transporter superfamily protein YnfA